MGCQVPVDTCERDECGAVAGPSALIALDLDRTLIYSRRWFSEAADTPECVETRDGKEVSFMTVTAMNLLTQLASSQIVVPATTRSVAQYERIALPGGPYGFAVASSGGTILVGGQPDPTWTATVAATVRAESIALDAVMAALYARISDVWVHTVVVVDDLFCYLVAEESAIPVDFVAGWRRWCEPRGWRVSRQDRTLYTLPRSLCKSHAVDEVRRRLTDSGDLPPGSPVFAAGDGVLDAPLLAAATAAMCPLHGDLATRWPTDSWYATTTAYGATAAEQILTWCHSHVASRTHPRGHSRTASVPRHDR